LQRTLPKGFRRCQDYGFLHGNAKRILKIVQRALTIITPKEALIKRKKAICKKCHSPMNFTGFIPAQGTAKLG
jgi:hypothetical protein